MKYRHIGVVSLAFVVMGCSPENQSHSQGAPSPQVAVESVAVPSTDKRQIIQLSNAQRDHVLEQMRDMLGATQVVMEGLAQSDLAKVEAGARPSGDLATQTPEHKNEMRGLHMRKALPPEFRQMSKQAKRMFDTIADMAAAGESVSVIQGEFANGLLTCNACHSIYQIPNP